MVGQTILGPYIGYASTNFKQIVNSIEGHSMESTIGLSVAVSNTTIKGAPVCTFIWEEEDYPLNFEGFVSLFSRWICNKIWFLPYQYTSYNIHRVVKNIKN